LRRGRRPSTPALAAWLSYPKAPFHGDRQGADVVVRGALRRVFADPLAGGEGFDERRPLVDGGADRLSEVAQRFVDAAASVGAAIDLGGHDQAARAAAVANGAGLAD